MNIARLLISVLIGLCFPVFAVVVDASDAQTWFESGNNYYMNDEYEKAVECYTKAIELDPTMVWGYCNRASAYYFLGRYEEAIQDYSKVLETNPDDVEAHNSLGWIYLEIGEKEKSLYHFKRACDLGYESACYQYDAMQ